MKYFKALKETTYGPRLVAPGEIVSMDESATPDAAIWLPVTGGQSPQDVMADGAGALSADMPPAMFLQMDEMRQQLEGLPTLKINYAALEEDHARLQKEIGLLTTAFNDAKAQLAESRTTIAALHEERQAMQAEHIELMEKMQAEISNLKKKR